MAMAIRAWPLGAATINAPPATSEMKNAHSWVTPRSFGFDFSMSSSAAPFASATRSDAAALASVTRSDATALASVTRSAAFARASDMRSPAAVLASDMRSVAVDRASVTRSLARSRLVTDRAYRTTIGLRATCPRSVSAPAPVVHQSRPCRTGRAAGHSDASVSCDHARVLWHAHSDGRKTTPIPSFFDHRQPNRSRSALLAQPRRRPPGTWRAMNTHDAGSAFVVALPEPLHLAFRGRKDTTT